MRTTTRVILACACDESRERCFRSASGLHLLPRERVQARRVAKSCLQEQLSLAVLDTQPTGPAMVSRDWANVGQSVSAGLCSPLTPAGPLLIRLVSESPAVRHSARGIDLESDADCLAPEHESLQQ